MEFFDANEAIKFTEEAIRSDYTLIYLFEEIRKATKCGDRKTCLDGSWDYFTDNARNYIEKLGYDMYHEEHLNQWHISW